MGKDRSHPVRGPRPMLAVLPLLLCLALSMVVLGTGPGPAPVRGMSAVERFSLRGAGACTIAGGTPLQVQLSNPADGSVVLSSGSTPILNATQNSTCTLAPGVYGITAFANSDFVFEQWVSSGEGISVQQPTSKVTEINVVSTTSVSVLAQFAPSTSGGGAGVPLDLELGVVAVVAVVVVVALLWSRGHRRARSAAAAAPPASAPSPPKGPDAPSGPASAVRPSGPVPLESWTRYAASFMEGVLEEDLWPSVAGTIDPAKLLCFTWGRAERLASRYGLTGAFVVRVSRVESVSGGDRVAPTDVDKMVDLVEKHFHKGTGRGVVIPDVHAIVNAAEAKSVIRLLQISRDLALESQGSLLFTVDPTTLPRSDLGLLERGAHQVASAS